MTIFDLSTIIENDRTVGIIHALSPDVKPSSGFYKIVQKSVQKTHYRISTSEEADLILYFLNTGTVSVQALIQVSKSTRLQYDLNEKDRLREIALKKFIGIQPVLSISVDDISKPTVLRILCETHNTCIIDNNTEWNVLNVPDFTKKSIGFLRTSTAESTEQEMALDGHESKSITIETFDSKFTICIRAIVKPNSMKEKTEGQ